MVTSIRIARLRRRIPAPIDPPLPGAALDRSALLAELEVNVPAPSRIVHWDTATKTCPTCVETVARGAIRCRHCGETLPSA